MTAEGFHDFQVAAVFDAYPEPLRTRLMALRAFIFAVAVETPGVGRLAETLKWGQPSYLTPETKSGSTIRIDRVKGEAGRYALYVHCQSGLVDAFRDLYARDFTFAGTRAILFDVAEPLPVGPLSHCVALALTHHARKRKGSR